MHMSVGYYPFCMQEFLEPDAASGCHTSLLAFCRRMTTARISGTLSLIQAGNVWAGLKLKGKLHLEKIKLVNAHISPNDVPDVM